MLEVKNISKSFALSENRDYCVLNKISFTLPDRGFFYLAKVVQESQHY